MLLSRRPLLLAALALALLARPAHSQGWTLEEGSAIGFLQSNAANFPLVVWGVLPLSALIGTDEALGETLIEVHELVARVLLVLIGLHVAGALRHHFLLKDDVLRRMLPAARRRH